jgi:hypothetical protein
MTHDDYRQLAAGAALGDLEADEWRDATDHEAGCGECARLGASLRASLAELSLLAPRRVPPTSLGAGVLAAVRAEGALERSSPRLAPVIPIGRPGARPRRSPLYAAVGLAAAFAIAAIGLGANTLGLQSSLDAARGEAAHNAALAAALADPAHRTASLHAEALAPGASAVILFIPGTAQGWLIADHMPATPAGHAYQLWYADASGAHPLETATWNGQGVMVASVAVDLAHSAAVMVTLESTGGATGEPGPQVVFGELAAAGA